jgi:hypothetical protein
MEITEKKFKKLENFLKKHSNDCNLKHVSFNTEIVANEPIKQTKLEKFLEKNMKSKRINDSLSSSSTASEIAVYQNTVYQMPTNIKRHDYRSGYCKFLPAGITISTQKRNI